MRFLIRPIPHRLLDDLEIVLCDGWETSSDGVKTRSVTILASWDLGDTRRRHATLEALRPYFRAETPFQFARPGDDREAHAWMAQAIGARTQATREQATAHACSFCLEPALAPRRVLERGDARICHACADTLQVERTAGDCVFCGRRSESTAGVIANRLCDSCLSLAREVLLPATDS